MNDTIVLITVLEVVSDVEKQQNVVWLEVKFCTQLFITVALIKDPLKNHFFKCVEEPNLVSLKNLSGALID